uniref:Uncharacterized protein n=1 Tax=Romanomermis culicivorax TaxID=13658 RepID=A0A915HHH6_ROMCU
MILRPMRSRLPASLSKFSYSTACESTSWSPNLRNLSANLFSTNSVTASPKDATTALSPPEKRDVSLSNVHATGFFFNTHQMVKMLCRQGFSAEQAEAVTDLLTHLITTQSEIQFKSSVSKEQLEISVQQLLAQIDSVKKDMLILEKSQFAHLRHDLDGRTFCLGSYVGDILKLLLNINQLESKLADECAKLKGGFALDMNLEKSRAKEDSRSQIQKLSSKFECWSAIEHKIQSEIQELSNRIGLEVANMRADIAHLRAHFEGSRTDIIKYVANFLFPKKI